MSDNPLAIESAFSVRGKVVLVTGALGLIGLGIVEAFAVNGALVAASDHRIRLPVPGPWFPRHDVLSSLKKQFPDLFFAPANLAEPADLRQLIAQTVAHFGRLDAVVHCGGIPYSHGIGYEGDEAFDRLFHINLRSGWILAREALPHLEKTQGCIVTIASVNGHRPTFAGPLYAATKAGVISLTRDMANEFGAKCVRANTVSPGPIPGSRRMAWYISENLTEEYAAKVERWIADHLDEYGRSGQPLARGGRPSDVALACIYLCSPAARYVSGADVLVDGGYLHHFANWRNREDTFWPPLREFLRSFPPAAWTAPPPEWLTRDDYFSKGPERNRRTN